MFLIYAHRKLPFPPMQFNRYDTEVTVALPKESSRYFTSKYKTDEIEQISSNLQRIWIRIINKSLTENIVIKRGKVFGFFVLESKSKVAIKHEMETKKHNHVENIKKSKKAVF